MSLVTILVRNNSRTLSLWIKQNPDIEGIKSKQGDDYTISQFADDTSMAILNNRRTITSTFDTLQRYGEESGLKLNINKTEILTLGTTSKDDIPSRYRNLVKKEVKILGVMLGGDHETTQTSNYEPILNKMKATIDKWKGRPMSLAGKITIIKTLITSKLVYAMSNLPSPKPAFWKEVNNILYKFIYDGKQDKIKRTYLLAPYEEGGYKMIDIETQNNAAKMTWIHRLQEVEGTWKTYIMNKIPTDIRYFVRCNIKFKDLPFQLPQNSIWREIWANWCIENFNEQPTAPEEIINQNLWYNSNIKINKKVVHYRKWEEKGIRWLNDILIEDTDMSLRFLSYEELCDFFDFKPIQLTYQGLIHAIPSSWKNTISIYDGQETEENEDYKLADRLSDSKKPTNLLYRSMIKGKYKRPSETITKWSQELEVDIEEKAMLNLQLNQRNCTKNNTLRSFNFKFFHRAVPYEARLFKMGIKQTPNCQHCQEKETITHLYWTCPQSQRLWERLKHLIETHLKVLFLNTPEHCLLGSTDHMNKRKIDATNLLCILTKYYIHVNKCNDTEKSTIGLENYIKSKLKIEEAIAERNYAHNLFNDRWANMVRWVSE